MSDAETLRGLARLAVPLHGTPDDFTPLLSLVGDARVVLLGEASRTPLWEQGAEELPETYPSAL